MGERKCPGCGSAFRKGRLALVAVEGGFLQKRVCVACARCALRMVAPTHRPGAECLLCTAVARYCEEHRTRDVDYSQIDRALTRLLSELSTSKAMIPMGPDRGAAADALESQIEGIEKAQGIVRELAQGRPVA
jgi:hypothetical protein